MQSWTCQRQTGHNLGVTISCVSTLRWRQLLTLFLAILVQVAVRSVRLYKFWLYGVSSSTLRGRMKRRGNTLHKVLYTWWENVNIFSALTNKQTDVWLNQNQLKCSTYILPVFGSKMVVNACWALTSAQPAYLIKSFSRLAQVLDIVVTDCLAIIWSTHIYN